MNRNEPMRYEEFGMLLAQRHALGEDFNFSIWHADTDGDLLPINNDNNLARALLTARCLLRIFIQRKGRIIFVLCIYVIIYLLNVINVIIYFLYIFINYKEYYIIFLLVLKIIYHVMDR